MSQKDTLLRQLAAIQGYIFITQISLNMNNIICCFFCLFFSSHGRNFRCFSSPWETTNHHNKVSCTASLKTYLNTVFKTIQIQHVHKNTWHLNNNLDQVTFADHSSWQKKPIKIQFALLYTWLHSYIKNYIAWHQEIMKQKSKVNKNVKRFFNGQWPSTCVWNSLCMSLEHTPKGDSASLWKHNATNQLTKTAVEVS